MDPAAHPKYEVATIKQVEPDANSSGFTVDGKDAYVRNKSMSDIVAWAFNVHKKQIVNMPDWFDSERFDIRGVADTPGSPSWPQFQEMLRALLQERLNLRMHHETRDLSRFVMRVGRGGVKLSPTTYKGKNGIDHSDQTGNGSAGKQEWKMRNNSMDEFAGFLRGFLDRPVVNETGVKGKYDFSLNWAREDAPANADTGGLPGLLTALQEQLGLKVEADKGPTDVIVMDHVEKPSDN